MHRFEVRVAESAGTKFADVEHSDTALSGEIQTANQSPPQPASITLILPAWNEAEVIADAVAEADAALSQVTGEYEIVVVDDGSTDQTADIVDRLAATNDRLRLVRHSLNQGYGAAIRSGFDAAGNELVVFTDADCQFDLTELDRFVLLSDRYDIVCGYRIDRKDTPLRCLYSKIYNLLVRAMLGTEVRDVDCALKMFHRDVAKQFRISGDGFLVNSELLTQAKQLGCQIVEVGVSHRPRTSGKSTVSMTHIPKVLASLVRFWWNEVQFPSHRQAAQPNIQRPVAGKLDDKTLRILQWGLLVIAAVFMLTNLGYPLIDRDETRYAEISREMITTANWILPQLNFETYYDKPPMLYWLCAISFKLFGMSETSARLVPALAALATLTSTMFFGSRIFGRRIGLIAGGVLLLSVGFAFTSRYLLLDGVLSLFVSLSLLTAYEAIRPVASREAFQPRFGWWLLSGICIGLAFLTKGPVALVLSLPPVFAMAWLSDDHAKPRWWHYGILAMVAAMVAGPWFMAVHQQDPTFLIEFFYKHNVARFTGEFHPKPFWFFVPVVLLAGHPWSFLTIPYAKFLFGRGEATRRQRTPAVGYLLLWSAWCFVFFSLSKCKLPTYLLPAAPALALMIGQYLSEVLRDVDNPAQHFFARFWSARSATVATSFAGVAFVLFVIFSTSEPTMMLFGWAMLWATLLMTSLLLMADRHQARIAWGTSSAVAFLFSVMVMHAVVPAYSRSNTLFGESSPLVRQLAVDAQLPNTQRPSTQRPSTQLPNTQLPNTQLPITQSRIAQLPIAQLPIATIDHEFSEVPFYLNRGDIENFADVDDEGLNDFVLRSGIAILFVDDRVDPEDVLRQLPNNTKLTEVAKRGCARIFQATTNPNSQPSKPRQIASLSENAFHGSHQ